LPASRRLKFCSSRADVPPMGAARPHACGARPGYSDISPRWTRRAAALVATLLGLLGATSIVSAAAGAGVRATGKAADKSVSRTAQPLVFGIYPGGGAGTVGPAGQTVPENPRKRLAALEQLRPRGHPFVLHIYANYSGSASPSPAEQVGSDIASYTAAGFQVELVLTYRPADPNPASDVPSFAQFARSAVRSFGSNPSFVALQVTNEINIRNAPDAADGYYAGAEDALIQGVIGAKEEARRHSFGQVRVGFNWAYSLDSHEAALWRGLGERGGAAFRGSIDWVGLDVYPGTWGPRPADDDLQAITTKTMLDALAVLRGRFMPLAGLPLSVPLHISENGYPTGPERTQAMQVAVMLAAIAAVNENRSQYHISDYRWFDLRDAHSSSSSFESQYGLMHDDYTPKAAFVAYRELVATLGAAAGDSPQTPLKPSRAGP
jgi:hypothetical protein